jgi:hypothetical protein
MLFRLLALSLAIGGSIWGLFTMSFLLVGAHPFDFIRLFGPGYVVTVLYIARACHTPNPNWRIMLWISSALIQGAWFGPVLLEVSRRGLPEFSFELLSLGWWMYAFVVSVCGIVGDVVETHEKQPDV